MRRKTFDTILTAVGAAMTVVLVVAGFLLWWGYSFANSNVHDQLAQQKIFFPAKGSPSFSASEYPTLQKYAGEQLTTGQQAQAYANHFIGHHLEGVANGKTYSQVSEEARANPNDQKLQGEVDTLFRGETLRGLLLNAYAFWKIGQIAMWAALAAWISAGVMLILTALGVWHLRRVTPEAEI